MAVVQTDSTIVGNLDATPVVHNHVTLMGGRVRVQRATVEVAAADDDASVYRMFRVQSNWAIVSIVKFNDAITGGTAYDFGIYNTAANGNAVVDDDVYAKDLDLSSADTSGTEIAFEQRDIANIEKYIWEDAGLSADPVTEYDLGFKADTVGTAAGTISVVLQYVAD